MIGRLLSFGAALAVTAGGVAYARAVPPQVVPSPAAVTLPILAVTPTTQCPGPETLLVPDGAKPAPVDGPTVVTTLVGTGGTVAVASSTRTAAGAVPLAVKHADVTSAVQATLGRSGDLRGIAATACGAAVTDAWLVGGGTVAGERARLLLSNPTSSSAQVDVAVHGPDGAVPTPTAQALVVPAGGSLAVLLDAVAPDLDRLAVHVTARTGRVVATLHDTLVRGLTPGGVDDVGIAAAPATKQVLPGVVVASPATSTVRVAAPDGEAVVRVRLIGPGGDVEVPSGVLTVPANGVRDLDLTGVPDGTYTAVVEADAPVVASARSSVTVPGGELAGTASALGKQVPPSELAWTTAASPLRGAVAIAVPAVTVKAALVLAAPVDAARLTLREVAADGTVGDPRQIDLDAGTSQEIAVTTGAAGVLITPPGAPGTGGPAYASLVLRATDKAGPMLSVAPVRPGTLPQASPPVAQEDGAIG